MFNMKKGEYSAKYFHKTKIIASKFKSNTIITLQFFQRKDNAMFGGIKEVLKLLKDNTDTTKYTIKYLREGTIINANDVVLELEGDYSEFGIYEGVIDGILSRWTSLATNAKNIVDVAQGKMVIFMGDRSDHYLNQPIDGQAIALGGIVTQVTSAHVSGHGGIDVGTMPHALIQMFNGDTLEAAKAYHKTFPNDPLTVLVDFENDVINTSKTVLKYFGNDLKAIRVDTALDVSDAFFAKNEEFGVTPNLIKGLRKALNMHNGKHVKIIVSSGFNVKKIKKFEDENTPVDIYGVGASLLKINNTFTADAVKINGNQIAKTGRKYKKNVKLIQA